MVIQMLQMNLTLRLRIENVGYEQLQLIFKYNFETHTVIPYEKQTHHDCFSLSEQRVPFRH